MSTSLSLGTLVLIVAGVLFIIARQFREKQAKPLMLALVPLLVAYHTYLGIQQELTHPLVSSTLVVACLAAGVLPGAILGFFRGRVIRLRVEGKTGQVYYAPSLANGLFWLGMLIIKVLAGIGIYLRLDQTGAVPAILLAAATTLFLGYVCVTCAILYWRITHLAERLAPAVSARPDGS
jgi:hypothetical protein